MMEYRAAIHAENNYYYVECKSKEEASQIISGWMEQINVSDDPYKFLEYKPFCYVRYDQIVGIELCEWDQSLSVCSPYVDDCQTTLDSFVTFDYEPSATTVTKES